MSPCLPPVPSTLYQHMDLLGHPSPLTLLAHDLASRNLFQSQPSAAAEHKCFQFTLCFESNLRLIRSSQSDAVRDLIAAGLHHA